MQVDFSVCMSEGGQEKFRKNFKRQKTIKYYFQINIGIFKGFIVGMAIVGGLIKRDKITIRFIGVMPV